MKVILNCSTLNKGGSLQAAVSFIRTAVKRSDEIQWHFIVSKSVAYELQYSGSFTNCSLLTVMDESPAKSYKSRGLLRKIVEEHNPDVVFTFFGPSYVDFSKPHLCGVADGWVTHGDHWAWKTVEGPLAACKLVAHIAYKAIMYRKADAWVTESLLAKEGLKKRLRLSEDRIFVVPNSCGTHYLNCQSDPKSTSGKKTRILCMAAFYRHKNLNLVPHVAKELQIIMPNLNFEFVMTIPHSEQGFAAIASKAKELGVLDKIINVGRVSVGQGPELYRSCQILFLPSVLETFSANYPEAMAMGVPIVTTDLRFARDVCGDAALYFKPMNARDAARAIGFLTQNEEFQRSLIEKGKRVLAGFPDQDTKYDMYKRCIRSLHEQCAEGKVEKSVGNLFF